MLIASERAVTAELIAHLAEMETRDIHLREGYPSLYLYCRDVLALSEWEAYNRIEVARAVRRSPSILALLAEGSVNLTSVKLLAPHLTPANHQEVLQAARGRKKFEVAELVARLCPRADVPQTLRRVPERSSKHGAGPETSASDGHQGLVAVAAAPGAGHSPLPSAPPDTAPSPGAAAILTPPALVTPLAPERYKLQLTIGIETLEKLRLAKDMLGHAVPSGDDATVLDRALTALHGELARKKFAGARRPRPSRQGKPGARTPSAAVKRAVWLRDLGRCAFVGTTGHRCGERRFVEFHHVDPFALGGEATVDGIQLRCRHHNDYEGRLYFGKRRGTCPQTKSERRGGELVPEQVRLSPGGSS
jgi:hypothetical protein